MPLHQSAVPFVHGVKTALEASLVIHVIITYQYNQGQLHGILLRAVCAREIIALL